MTREHSSGGVDANAVRDAGDATGPVPLALSRDLRPGAPLPLHHRGEELVAWRTADGAVRLWRDRCPHRGMRLSFGFVTGGSGEDAEDERLHCLYHGWGYGADGTCRAIPAHPDLTPPRTIRAEVLAAREAGGLVWLGTPDHMPGGVPKATGVRTLALPLGEAEARAALHLDGPWRMTDERDGTPEPLLVALAPHGPERCALHVLLLGQATPEATPEATTEATPERHHAASRWAAALRDGLAATRTVKEAA